MNFIKKIIYCFFIVTVSLGMFASLGSASAVKYVKSWGSELDTSKLLRTPVAMARDAKGFLYVVDMGNNRILKIDKNGEVVDAIGTFGEGPGQFNMPFGIAVDKEGNILVADTANYRIQKFNEEFQFIKSWGTKGKGSEQFSFPREIAVDSDNNYYITDEYNHRIQKYSPDGP